MSRRPLDPHSESRRLTIVISEAEHSAIDEWRWQNRTSSHSEAARQLIRRGLSVPCASILDAGERKVSS